jgi:hypothetical protein
VHEGLSVAMLMTYLCQLGYTGLFLRTLKSSWYLWWIPWKSVCNLRRKSLELLLITNFPNLEVTEEMAASATAHHAGSSDWREAVSVVTYRTVEWAISSFAPHRSLGLDGIFLAFLQEGRRVVVPNLVRIFCACLATGYVPAIWHQVKVVVVGT